ncbi:MAG: flagellar hook basal-body protein [Burkholderiales bacterium]|nr:flagellar hook basal-body protein [Burkholderiales bacterium]
MADAFTIAVQSMQNDLQRLDTISQNVVNSTTPGYRRALTTPQTFGDVLQRTTLDGVSNAVSITLPAVSTVVDQSTGPLKSTGHALDVALDGDGYFELTTPQGLAYTRAGNFHLDDRGRLVSQDGYAVNGKGGDIVVSGKAPVTISAEGEVSEGDNVVGQLNIVAFADKHGLEKTATGLLKPTHADTQGKESQARVRTGFLEGSNVVPLREMVSMLETSRHFESQQKLFQGYDDQISTAIQKLGQF